MYHKQREYINVRNFSPTFCDIDFIFAVYVIDYADCNRHIYPIFICTHKLLTTVSVTHSIGGQKYVHSMLGFKHSRR